MYIFSEIVVAASSNVAVDVVTITTFSTAVAVSDVVFTAGDLPSVAADFSFLAADAVVLPWCFLAVVVVVICCCGNPFMSHSHPLYHPTDEILATESITVSNVMSH